MSCQGRDLLRVPGAQHPVESGESRPRVAGQHDEVLVRDLTVAGERSERHAQVGRRIRQEVDSLVVVERDQNLLHGLTPLPQTQKHAYERALNHRAQPVSYTHLDVYKRQTREAIAAELVQADRDRTILPRLTARYPEMAIEDSYAIQKIWSDQRIAQGARLVGHKIGLTSKVMQVATGITEPDYGVIHDDMVFESGSVLEFDRFSNVRIEVELAFVLAKPLSGPNTTIFDVLDATCLLYTSRCV